MLHFKYMPVARIVIMDLLNILKTAMQHVILYIFLHTKISVDVNQFRKWLYNKYSCTMQQFLLMSFSLLWRKCCLSYCGKACKTCCLCICNMGNVIGEKEESVGTPHSPQQMIHFCLCRFHCMFSAMTTGTSNHQTSSKHPCLFLFPYILVLGLLSGLSCGRAPPPLKE